MKGEHLRENYLGTISEVLGYFKPSNKKVDLVKKVLEKLGFTEVDDETLKDLRMIHFDGELAEDLAKTKSLLKKKFPNLKVSYSESTDEDTPSFYEVDKYEFKTLVIEG